MERCCCCRNAGSTASGAHAVSKRSSTTGEAGTSNYSSSSLNRSMIGRRTGRTPSAGWPFVTRRRKSNHCRRRRIDLRAPGHDDEAHPPDDQRNRTGRASPSSVGRSRVSRERTFEPAGYPDSGRDSPNTRAHLQRRSGTRNTRTFVTAAAYPSSTCALHLQMRTFSGDAHRSVRLGILRGWRFSSCRRLLARISCRGPGGRSSKPGEK